MRAGVEREAATVLPTHHHLRVFPFEYTASGQRAQQTLADLDLHFVEQLLVGGMHRDHPAMVKNLREALREASQKFSAVPTGELLQARHWVFARGGADWLALADHQHQDGQAETVLFCLWGGRGGDSSRVRERGGLRCRGWSGSEPTSGAVI